MSVRDIKEIEREIDEAFASNELTTVPWTQSAWTVLSVAEDYHFNIAVARPLPEREAAIYVDGLVNTLTHPLRVLRERAPKLPTSLDRRYIEAHYGLAHEWLGAAEDYNHFCSMFPLFHAKEIELNINEDTLEPTDWSSTDLSYETYDRFVGKRAPESERSLDATAVEAILRASIRASGGAYSVDFSRRLVDELKRHLAPAFDGRHVLPENWQFSRFSLAEYRAIFVFLQIAAEAWFAARQIVAPGVRGIAYEGSVWTPRKGALFKLLSRHTRQSGKAIQSVLEYLTFGAVGIRNPDIAIQPLVDLGNDHFAISPFLMTQIHAERNLCVLLNQVPADRKLYAALVDDKEEHLRAETIEALQPLGFAFRYGEIGQTDVDLAVIDPGSKICLCIELKWFIEPAEIREVRMRSEELAKGVSQAKILNELYATKDGRLLGLLGIPGDYQFLAMVGSVNFIGRAAIQDPDVPIAKLWHVVAKIQETGSLLTTIEWLKARQYLPVKHRDYEVQEIPIQSGRWKSRWYGIKHA
jgi:hypothetical protein